MRLLTDAELELMSLLWAQGPLTARESLAHLPDDRPYTTVSTFFRILVEKGFATSEPRGRAHVYTAALSRNAYRARKLRHVMDGLFDGSALELARHLVQSDLSPDERASLQTLVDDLGPDDG